MRISLVISGMGAGGAERVMKTLADAWVERGHEVTLITLEAVERDFIRCDPRVKRVGLGLMAHSSSLVQAVRRNRGRVKVLRSALIASRPQVVVSFNDKTNVLVLLAAKHQRWPVIVCEHIDPYRHDIGRLWAVLRQATYPRAAVVVGVTGAAEQFVRRFVKNRPVITLPNPILPPVLPQPLPPPPWPPGPALIAMGRLNPQKGFDLLLESFAKVADDFPAWRLVILGEGEQRPLLEGLIGRLGLKGRAILAGRVADPLPLLASAQIFVLSSRYEGFPMALMEAMSVGLPVVATDCTTGVREIMRPSVDGLLVAPLDKPALAQAMAELMGDETLRSRLAAKAPEVLSRFGLETILARWDALFASLGLAS